MPDFSKLRLPNATSSSAKEGVTSGEQAPTPTNDGGNESSPKAPLLRLPSSTGARVSDGAGVGGVLTNVDHASVDGEYDARSQGDGVADGVTNAGAGGVKRVSDTGNVDVAGVSTSEEAAEIVTGKFVGLRLPTPGAAVENLSTPAKELFAGVSTVDESESDTSTDVYTEVSEEPDVAEVTDPEDLWEADSEELEDDTLLYDDSFGGDYSTGENPLLDDDEEDDLIVGSADLAERLAHAGGMTEFAAADGDEDEEDFQGFSSQLNDLLDDDESPAKPTVSSSESSQVTAGEVTESSVERSVPAVIPAKGWTPPSDYRTKKSPAELEAYENSRTSTLREREVKAAEEKEWDSDFVPAPVRTVRVNAAGETRAEQKRERTRLVKQGPSGKLRRSEIEFFTGLGSMREASYSDGMVRDAVNENVIAGHESAGDRRATRRRLERVLDDRNLFRSGVKLRLDDKTVDTLMFLALFRYATHSHLSRMFGEKPDTTVRRLRKLREVGLVGSRKLFSQHDLWTLTDAGIVVSGFDVKKVTDARLTPSMFPHQFTVNHVAGNLLGGKLNVLDLPDFPAKRRLDVNGQPRFGEDLTSELEILSSFSKVKLFEQSSTFRPKLLAIRDAQFAEWGELENRSETLSPEMVLGNEWMFTLIPPLSVGIAYHVPDLVVKRTRGANGAPRSIAVEIEISNKPLASYERTLKAYMEDKLIYRQVIWVCKTLGTAKKLEKVGKELGLIQRGDHTDRLRIVPIWTNDGVFKGRNLWMI